MLTTKRVRSKRVCYLLSSEKKIYEITWRVFFAVTQKKRKRCKITFFSWWIEFYFFSLHKYVNGQTMYVNLTIKILLTRIEFAQTKIEVFYAKIECSLWIICALIETFPLNFRWIRLNCLSTNESDHKSHFNIYWTMISKFNGYTLDHRDNTYLKGHASHRDIYF